MVFSEIHNLLYFIFGDILDVFCKSILQNRETFKRKKVRFWEKWIFKYIYVYVYIFLYIDIHSLSLSHILYVFNCSPRLLLKNAIPHIQASSTTNVYIHIFSFYSNRLDGLYACPYKTLKPVLLAWYQSITFHIPIGSHFHVHIFPWYLVDYSKYYLVLEVCSMEIRHLSYIILFLWCYAILLELITII